MANSTYYNHYQIPVFFFLLTVLWLVVIARLLVFLRQSFPGWRHLRGVSMVLILVAALFCTIYVFLLLTILLYNLRIDRLKERVIPGTNLGREQLDSMEKLTDAQVDEVIRIIGRIHGVVIAARILLLIGIYVVKAAFLVIFWETKGQLSRSCKSFLFLTTVFIFISFIVAMWFAIKDIIVTSWNGWLELTREDIRGGISGVYYLGFETAIELLHNVLNITTDLCLASIAYATVRSFPVPLRAVIFPCSLVVTTICIAVSRLPILIIDMKLPNFATTFIIPFQLLAEAEMFLAVIVACLPGLRVWVRMKREDGVRNGDRENNSGTPLKIADIGGIGAGVVTTEVIAGEKADEGTVGMNGVVRDGRLVNGEMALT